MNFNPFNSETLGTKRKDPPIVNVSLNTSNDAGLTGFQAIMGSNQTILANTKTRDPNAILDNARSSERYKSFYQALLGENERQKKIASTFAREQTALTNSTTLLG